MSPTLPTSLILFDRAVARRACAAVAALLLGFLGPAAVANSVGPAPFEHEHHSDHSTGGGVSLTLAEPRPRCHRELVVATHGVFAGARFNASRLTAQASRVLALHDMRDRRNGLGAPLLT